MSKNLSVVFTGFRSNSTAVLQSLFYVVDLRDHLPEWVTFGFSASAGEVFAKQSILSWNFNPTSQVHGTIERNISLWVGLGASLVVIALVALVLFAVWKWRNELENSGVKNDDESERGAGPVKTPYKVLACATDNFSEENRVGVGGFGAVYKGHLSGLNVDIAVKMKSRDSEQGIKEYRSEVKTISGLRYRNLVRLIGWCRERKRCFKKNQVLLLVYEFMPNGNLYSHLFNKNNFLSWDKRFKIAQGLASALLHLHEEWESSRYVVHRDVKSKNILLDSNFNTKLRDFGLVKVVEHGKEIRTSTKAGTFGYVAPEFLNGIVNKELDVYSFGVVALEMVCGRKSIELHAEINRRNMVNWVRELYGMGTLMEAVDPRLGMNFDKRQMERLLIVGLWCTNTDCSLRPSIREAILVLNSNEASLLEIPVQMPVPTFPSPSMAMHASSISSSYYDTATGSNQL